MKRNIEYIVMERRASYGGYSGYTLVSLLLINRRQLPPGSTEPKMMSERGRGVLQVMGIYGPYYTGTTDRCEYSRNIDKIRERARDLNAALLDPDTVRQVLFPLIEHGDIKLTDLTEENQVLWDKYQSLVVRMPSFGNPFSETNGEAAH